MKSKKTPYDQLFELSKTIKTLTSVEYLLDWDQETLMPLQAIDFRAEQKGLMAGHIHKLKTSTKFSHLLNQLIDLESGQVLDSSLSQAQCAALREWRRDHLQPLNSLRLLSKLSPPPVRFLPTFGLKLKKPPISLTLLPA